VPENTILDDNHVWLLNQKYRGGAKASPLPFGWRPESTQLFDPTISREFTDIPPLFDHLLFPEELEQALGIPVPKKEVSDVRPF
jgi:hypothetical protein